MFKYRIKPLIFLLFISLLGARPAYSCWFGQCDNIRDLVIDEVFEIPEEFPYKHLCEEVSEAPEFDPSLLCNSLGDYGLNLNATTNYNWEQLFRVGQILDFTSYARDHSLFSKAIDETQFYRDCVENFMENNEGIDIISDAAIAGVDDPRCGHFLKVLDARHRQLRLTTAFMNGHLFNQIPGTPQQIRPENRGDYRIHFAYPKRAMHEKGLGLPYGDPYTSDEIGQIDQIIEREINSGLPYYCNVRSPNSKHQAEVQGGLEGKQYTDNWVELNARLRCNPEELRNISPNRPEGNRREIAQNEWQECRVGVPNPMAFNLRELNDGIFLGLNPLGTERREIVLDDRSAELLHGNCRHGEVDAFLGGLQDYYSQIHEHELRELPILGYLQKPYLSAQDLLNAFDSLDHNARQRHLEHTRELDRQGNIIHDTSKKQLITILSNPYMTEHVLTTHPQYCNIVINSWQKLLTPQDRNIVLDTLGDFFNFGINKAVRWGKSAACAAIIGASASLTGIPVPVCESVAAVRSLWTDYHHLMGARQKLFFEPVGLSQMGKMDEPARANTKLLINVTVTVLQQFCENSGAIVVDMIGIDACGAIDDLRKKVKDLTGASEFDAVIKWFHDYLGIEKEDMNLLIEYAQSKAKSFYQSTKKDALKNFLADGRDAQEVLNHNAYYYQGIRSTYEQNQEIIFDRGNPLLNTLKTVIDLSFML